MYYTTIQSVLNSRSLCLHLDFSDNVNMLTSKNVLMEKSLHALLRAISRLRILISIAIMAINSSGERALVTSQRFQTLLMWTRMKNTRVYEDNKIHLKEEHICLEYCTIYCIHKGSRIFG